MRPAVLGARFPAPAKEGERGVSLIEVMIGVAVFSLIATALFAGLFMVLRSAITTRARIAGLALANERLEVIRNLAYEAVGTVEGLPKGDIPATQAITRDGFPFSVRTTIRQIDDPFDGTIGGTPDDTAPADYKVATVRVECPTCLEPYPPVELTTAISKGLELSTGNGAVFVQVFDALGEAVEGATVTVQDVTGGSFSVQETTDQDGYVRLLDVPPGTDAYRVEATRAGYTTDRTYPRGAPENPDPLKPDVTVVAGAVSEASLAIDRVSTIVAATVSLTCAAVGDVDLHSVGGQRIGNPDVRRFTTDAATDASGAATLADLEWGPYEFAVTDLAYDLVGTSSALPLQLSPNTSVNLSLIAGPTTPESLLVTVRDVGTGSAIDSASVRVAEADQTKTTGGDNPACATPGQAFFSGLAAGTYTIEVTAGGYTPFTGTVDVSGEVSLDVDLAPA